MASMFITRNALFRFPRSLPYAPSLSFKPTSLTFASAPNHSAWRNAAEGKRGEWTYDSAEGRRKEDEMSERAKESMSEGMERSKEYAEDAAGSVKEKAKEYAYDTKDAAGTVTDKTKEGAERTKEKTEEVAGSAKETLKNVGEKAKHSVQGAWEATKDTTQKIKDTVVGKDDHHDHDDTDSHFNTRTGSKGY